MAWLKVLLLTGLFSIFLIDLAPEATAAEDRGDWRHNACRRGDRIAIQDLDVSPDPLVEGQRIRAWKVRVKLDGNRDCNTEIEIREGGETVGRVRRTTLRPGITEIDVQPTERYRFQGREHCFNVVVDLDGTRREVDSARRFCAQQRPSWSMRERGDFQGKKR
jgi:hypothetical protein